MLINKFFIYFEHSIETLNNKTYLQNLPNVFLPALPVSLSNTAFWYFFVALRVPVPNLPEHKRAQFLGRVFQDPMKGTSPDMEIAENLSIAARRGTKRKLIWDIKKSERKKYKELLATLELGLETRLSTKVGLLSGGQRQAVTLLMAMINRPKLLLLDEHTAALDPKTAAKVLSLTNKIVTENNLTTLMITHNMHDAIEYGNRLIMMDECNIVVDVRGEEKKKLTIEQLLQLFEASSGTQFTDDKAILSK